MFIATSKHHFSQLLLFHNLALLLKLSVVYSNHSSIDSICTLFSLAPPWQTQAPSHGRRLDGRLYTCHQTFLSSRPLLENCRSRLSGRPSGAINCKMLGVAITTPITYGNRQAEAHACLISMVEPTSTPTGSFHASTIPCWTSLSTS
jgi:hypothetical protein